jgi:hypothetical protein
MLVARIAGVSAASLLFSIYVAQAQTPPSQERLRAIQNMASLEQQKMGKLSPQVKKALSGSTMNFLQFASAQQRVQQSFGPGTGQDQLARIQAALQTRTRFTSSIFSSGPIPVSDPSTDFLFSLMAGFTQSETSTAWCGSGVVAGFNDSGSVFEGLLFGPGGFSFSGAGASTDGGSSFRDIGYINPGSNVNNFLFGDPVVNCADANTFYYSQTGNSSTFDAPTSVVFLSKSTDGGFTWQDPIPAVSKDFFSHVLDKDWSAVDAKSPKNIYVSYTDIDFNSTLCPIDVRLAIEVVHSTDAGATWSAPTVVDEVCNSAPDFPFLQGSQIVVDSHGRVFVEWERFSDPASSTRELRIARSTDYAVSFGPSSKVDNVFPTGDGFALQGNFRTMLTGSLAVDRSGTKTEGDLYVTWEDGRFRSRPDLESPFGLYRNANVVISRSSDGGSVWSAPVRVNNDPLESHAGFGIDHFQPGAAVDSTGTVGVCWYDRRDDPLNYEISRYCGVSRDHKTGWESDHGAVWKNVRVDPRIWPPIHNTDVFIVDVYLGDYDTVATDTTQSSTGFQGAYGNVTLHAPVANQDVFLVQLNK